MTEDEFKSAIEGLGAENVFMLSRPLDRAKMGVAVSFDARGHRRTCAVRVPAAMSETDAYGQLLAWAEDGFARHWNRHAA